MHGLVLLTAMGIIVPICCPRVELFGSTAEARAHCCDIVTTVAVDGRGRAVDAPRRTDTVHPESVSHT